MDEMRIVQKVFFVNYALIRSGSPKDMQNYQILLKSPDFGIWATFLMNSYWNMVIWWQSGSFYHIRRAARDFWKSCQNGDGDAYLALGSHLIDQSEKFCYQTIADMCSLARNKVFFFFLSKTWLLRIPKDAHGLKKKRKIKFWHRILCSIYIFFSFFMFVFSISPFHHASCAPSNLGQPQTMQIWQRFKGRCTKQYGTASNDADLTTD